VRRAHRGVVGEHLVDALGARKLEIVRERVEILLRVQAAFRLGLDEVLCPKYGISFSSASR